MEQESEFLTIMEFANKLRVHPNTVRNCIRTGRIQSTRTGIGKRAQYRIPKTELGRLCEFDMTKLIEKIIEEKIEGRGGK